MNLLFLLWLHFVGDYPLQGSFLAQMKGKHDYLLLCHAIIWTGTISTGLWMIGSLAMWKVGFLLAGHFVIDRWKARKEDKTNALTMDLLIDQVLHFVQIAAVYYTK